MKANDEIRNAIHKAARQPKPHHMSLQVMMQILTLVLAATLRVDAKSARQRLPRRHRKSMKGRPQVHSSRPANEDVSGVPRACDSI